MCDISLFQQLDYIHCSLCYTFTIRLYVFLNINSLNVLTFEPKKNATVFNHGSILPSIGLQYGTSKRVSTIYISYIAYNIGNLMSSEVTHTHCMCTNDLERISSYIKLIIILYLFYTTVFRRLNYMNIRCFTMFVDNRSQFYYMSCYVCKVWFFVWYFFIQ